MTRKRTYITVTDMFCGCGGSTQGAALSGAEVIMAANHWDLAVRSHNTNFPETAHDCADVSQVVPRRWPSTDVLWASPECTNHSNAKGKRRRGAQMSLLGDEDPLDPAAVRSRATMWDVPRFAEYHDYRVIVVENVNEAQRQIWQWAIEAGRIADVLKEDGKLKSTKAVERLAAEMPGGDKLPAWPEGTRKTYWWCVDQYGWPLLGKAWSRLKARRINIDTFLRFSESQSDNPKLLAYYEVLRRVKISQACCDVLKKEPAQRVQAELDVDVIFKGLMASESRTRATNFLSRGYLFEGARQDYLGGDPFFHCQPMAIWTDEDVWAYIDRFGIPYSSLYDMGYTDSSGTFHRIKRNGCMGCATDLLFPNNHMATLRRTHNKAWTVFMRRGMAAEIQKLQRVQRNGQLSLFDVFDAEDLLERRPCIFDSINRLVLQDDTMAEDDLAFDPEVD